MEEMTPEKKKIWAERMVADILEEPPREYWLGDPPRKEENSEPPD